jgi:transposase
MPRPQIVLFATTLEDRIPEDHPVRLIDEILDRLDWTDWELEYDSGHGQPPIHPKVLSKVLLFAMIRGIRSSRKIEYALHHSIDFMWLASGHTIDHSTLSNFRTKHPERLRDIYQQMVRYAVSLGAAKLSELCLDGTRTRADASRHRTWKANDVEKLIAELNREFQERLGQMKSADTIDDLFDDGQAADKLPRDLADMQARREKLDAILRQLRDMETDRRTQQNIDPKKNPAQLPKADLDARVLPNKEGGYAPNYTPTVVTETTGGFIVDADVLIGNVEHLTLTTMVDTIAENYGVDIDAMLADTAFSTGANITGMEERDVELLSPLNEVVCENNPAERPDPTEPVAEEDRGRLPINPQTKRFDKSAFVYDETNDCYYCPAGKTLHRSDTETKQRASGPVKTTNYRCGDCTDCPLAEFCRKDVNAKSGRKVSRDEHAAARARHRDHMRDPAVKERYAKRLHFGETPFAVLKAGFGLRRFLVRGHEKVQMEWLWGCTAFNLKKLMAIAASSRAESATKSEPAVS